MHVFDFYFSDVSESDGARQHALKDCPMETQKLIDVLSAETLVHYALWVELPKGHPTGELWLETNTDIRASIYLAYGGYFRQALAVLRSWFEISVLGVFFGAHYGQPTGRYEQWKRGARNSPVKMWDICHSLAQRSDRSKSTDEVGFRARLLPLYEVLSKQVHSRGIEVYDLQGGRDNVPRYLEHSFTKWHQSVLDVFDAICFLFDEFYRNELRKYLLNAPVELKRARTYASALEVDVPDLKRFVENAIGPDAQANEKKNVKK